MMRKWAPDSGGRLFAYDPKSKYEWCVKDGSNVTKHVHADLFKM